ncbi:MAG: HAMP domain-containing histidine kinase [Candidatus Marinimicrobia bacterium]|nr:HAMP domain-containing histidine kinase [Candidatus Neomarinimicrobiota bacterium]MBL7010666.1 HAMP domain-containing histidine kinase [Candidatus Neomarinimicrobiota bacterium]MBL7030535.1 HAMP domain-containing histidine kinase [Candidatus Neomarinimicrobiota bacterium]
MNLRPKILSLVIGTMLIFFIVLIVPLYWYGRSAIEEELDKRLLTAADIISLNLDQKYIRLLVQEPALIQVRQKFEEQLSLFLIQQIEGIAVYKLDGTPLAMTNSGRPMDPSVFPLLQSVVQFGDQSVTRISKIYELPNGQFLKAAAANIELENQLSVTIVIWGGVEFMDQIDQLKGSIFWITLFSILVAISLSILFSQSLIRPVHRLSSYAKTIQKNIHAAPVDLDRKDELGALNRALMEMHREVQGNEQRNKQLLSGIAHEIKNPLGGMEIYSGLLAEELETESDLSTYVKKINKELYHLKQIVFSYLDYARPLKSDLKILQIDRLVEDVRQILIPEFKQKEVNFHLSGQGKITGDESKLRVVMMNLMKNSLAAVEDKGCIDIKIDMDSTSLSINITDDGVGIPKGKLEEIFQPYYSTREKGYGLGLAITQNIVHEMNGTVFAESTVGKGTTISLTFPL